MIPLLADNGCSLVASRVVPMDYLNTRPGKTLASCSCGSWTKVSILLSYLSTVVLSTGTGIPPQEGVHSVQHAETARIYSLHMWEVWKISAAIIIQLAGLRERVTIFTSSN